MQLILRPEAEGDINNARKWYESQREGLGDEFLLAVEAQLAAIQRYPMAYRTIFQEVRHVLTKRFPYGIFFQVIDDAVIVIAVMHSKRNPAWWQGRMQ